MFSVVRRWIAERTANRLSADFPRVDVVEVRDASSLAGPLFFKSFRQVIPDFPRHFVLVYRPAEDDVMALGYVHQTPFEGAHLCGGLAVDAWKLRQLPPPCQAQIRARGSMAEWLLRDSFERLAPTKAIFGYVGDAKAKIVDLRVGFMPVPGHPYLHIVPTPGVPQEELDILTAKVNALGPF